MTLPSGLYLPDVGIAEELEGILGRHLDLGTKDALKPYAKGTETAIRAHCRQ